MSEAHVPQRLDLSASRLGGEIVTSVILSCSCGRIMRHGSLGLVFDAYSGHSGSRADVAPFLERMFGPSLSVSVVDRGEDQCATAE